MDERPDDDALPRWLWLWFPPLILVAQVGAKAVGEDTYRAWMRNERGMVEILTVVFLAVAFVLGAWLFLQRRRMPARWHGGWMAAFALGCLYFGGEEASWGQHYFNWDTPEAWAAVNDQEETNLHNTWGILDQAPRNLLSLAVLFGAVIVPLLKRYRPDKVPWRGTPVEWIYPSWACLPTAVLSLVIPLPEKIIEGLGGEVPYLIEISPGESKEYFLGLLLMLYALELRKRVAARPTAAP